MVNILSEDYESIILNSNNQPTSQQIISHFTGIDPDGNSYMSLSGCKDKNCYVPIITNSDYNLAKSGSNPSVVDSDDSRVNYFAPNKYFTLSTEERDNKKIFNIGNDNPYINDYKELQPHGSNNFKLQPNPIEYNGIKDENSIFRIEEDNGNSDVFIKGNLHVSGDFLINGNTSGGGTVSSNSSSVGEIQQSFSGNTIEINAHPHKDSKNIDGGFIIKRYQKESNILSTKQ